MSRFSSPQEAHPLGESLSPSKAPTESSPVDPPGGRGHPTTRKCHEKARDVARRLGRPFRARGSFWLDSQGVALGWRRPRRWRAASAPYGAHHESTAPPRRHRKKSPKGHSGIRNSLIINTLNVVKGIFCGRVSPNTGPRPGFLRPNGAP